MVEGDLESGFKNKCDKHLCKLINDDCPICLEDKGICFKCGGKLSQGNIVVSECPKCDKSETEKPIDYIKRAKDIIEKETTERHGFSIKADNPDDLTLYKDGEAILKISLPEMSTQWNTKLP